MISTADKLACVKRELRMRERVYPEWVTRGRMSIEKMNLEIAVMREIVRDYEMAVDQMSLPL